VICSPCSFAVAHDLTSNKSHLLFAYVATACMDATKRMFRHKPAIQKSLDVAITWFGAVVRPSLPYATDLVRLKFLIQ